MTLIFIVGKRYMEVCNRPSAVVLNMDDKHLKQNGMGGLYNTVVSRVWRLLHCPLEVWYIYMNRTLWYYAYFDYLDVSIVLYMCIVIRTYMYVLQAIINLLHGYLHTLYVYII